MNKALTEDSGYKLRAAIERISHDMQHIESLLFCGAVKTIPPDVAQEGAETIYREVVDHMRYYAQVIETNLNHEVQP